MLLGENWCWSPLRLKGLIQCVKALVESQLDLFTSRAFERVARQWARSAIVRAPSAKRERASERKPGPTTPDQKTMRTTLRKSKSPFISLCISFKSESWNDSRNVSSDLKTILKTDFANLRFLELWERRGMLVNLNHVAWENSFKITWSKKR